MTEDFLNKLHKYDSYDPEYDDGLGTLKERHNSPFAYRWFRWNDYFIDEVEEPQSYKGYGKGKN